MWKKDHGPSLCWHCLNRLVYKRGGGFIFATVQEVDGSEHRVHKECVRPCIEDTQRKEVTKGRK